MTSRSAIVIGAGIVGLATARALAQKGYKVKVIERSKPAVGASIRNFGMIWPIGQPSGTLLNRAMRSREIWHSLSQKGVCWSNPVGSYHLAYFPEELEVLEEVYSLYGKERSLALHTPEEVLALSPAGVASNLKGGLFSPNETIVDPREAIEKIPGYLSSEYGIEFISGVAVTQVQSQKVFAGNTNWEADLVMVCSGQDFETLYPEVFDELAITKCKLQMMRLVQQPNQWQLGPSLCGGLSLVHYKSFAAAASLKPLYELYQQTRKEYLDWGIHVMVSQTGYGELTIGDSHEYGRTFDPFDNSTYAMSIWRLNMALIRAMLPRLFARLISAPHEIKC